MNIDKIFRQIDALLALARRKRDRLAQRMAGRSAYVAATGVLIAGFGLAGTSAATTPDAAPDENSGAVVGDPERDADAERADRTAREVPEPPVERPDWVNPMPGARITSPYGPRWGTMHAGMDFAAPENAPIFAAGAGTVTAAGWVYSGYGISVLIDHGDGYLTHYAHLNKANVEVGDTVSAGDLIGWEGSTGDSTGPHLHFEVHDGMWNQIDPAPWMEERGVDLG
jgi:murein DD-endopeptidase MepM/ murein hydrolase activator NlpD